MIVGPLKLSEAIIPPGAHIVSALAQLDTDLAAWLEDARLHPHDIRQTVATVAKQGGGYLSRREVLKAQAVGKPVTADVAADVAAELCGLLRSVARWSDGNELRVERAHRVGASREDIKNQEMALQSNLAFPSHSHSPLEAERTLRENVATSLAKKKTLVQRLLDLDPQGDAGRAAGVTAAVKKAGGVAAIAKVLGPLLPVTTPDYRVLNAEQELDAKIAKLSSRLEPIDPATQLAASLELQRNQLNAARQLMRTAAQTACESSAAKILVSASDGDLTALNLLGPQASAVSVEFDAAIQQARGTDAELVAAVRDILREDLHKREREARAKEDQRRRMSGL